MIYPNSRWLGNWDLVMIGVLIFSVMITPIRLAFVKSYEIEIIQWQITLYFIDFLFFCDICIIFNTAYFDENFTLVDDRKVIAKKYISSWFFIDIMSILPFDLLLFSTDLNSLVRFARIGRLYKLVRLTRLLRIFRIMKDKNKFMSIISDKLKIGLGFERLIFFVVLAIILCHIVACLWLLLPQFLS